MTEPKLAANFKKRHANQSQPQTSLEKYEEAVDNYKALLEDKTHPSQRTAAYKKNATSILNRLLVAADNLDAESPGSGIFGLIVLGLTSNLSLKDKNLELEVRVRDLENKMRKMSK